MNPCYLARCIAQILSNRPLMSTKHLALISTILSSLCLTACDSIPFVGNILNPESDYKTAGRARPLEVPPDLTSLSNSDTYSVPGGSTTYSEFSQGQNIPAAEKQPMLTNPDGVRLERAGAQRWLVVKATPDQVWPVVRDFWNDLGFAVRVENQETGVMETEWLEADKLKNKSDDGILTKTQAWLDKLNGLSNKQKFRTRIDLGSELGSTEIYMTHRNISDTASDDGINRIQTTVGTYENGYKITDKRYKNDDERASAEDLDAELLRRLMVKLGVEEKKSHSIMTASSAARASLTGSKNGPVSLTVNDPFDRAWRRVGLALDRIGFVVEDKNRDKGLFYVRYADNDASLTSNSKKNKGWLSSLKFWGDEEKDAKEAEAKNTNADSKKGEISKSEPEETKISLFSNKKPNKLYLVRVDQSDTSPTAITVVDKDGQVIQTTTAQNILSLLYDQLK